MTVNDFITQHTSLAERLARSLGSRYTFMFDDIISEAYLALCEYAPTAMKLEKPTHYISKCIWGRLRHFVNRNKSAVSMPPATYMLCPVFSLSTIQATSGDEPMSRDNTRDNINEVYDVVKDNKLIKVIKLLELGFNQTEIARILEITRAAVSLRINKIRGELQKGFLIDQELGTKC